METITLKIKRPSLSSILSGAYSKAPTMEELIARTAQYFIDEPEKKLFLEEALDEGNFEIEYFYELEGMQYDILKKMSDDGALDTKVMHTFVMNVVEIFVKALDVANMKYKGEQQ